MVISCLVMIILFLSLKKVFKVVILEFFMFKIFVYNNFIFFLFFVGGSGFSMVSFVLVEKV